jgi:hypothetical protein
MVWRKLFPERAATRVGTVYLLHFETPFAHAQHYIGFTEAPDPEQRLIEQLQGSGANLLRHVVAAGIPILLAKEWHNVSQRVEYQLKNRGGAGRICPICKSLRCSDFGPGLRDNCR